ncbi:unnamed protein product [Auanema sp. JU1783]|nr:unnamed protein product [Auanema sp. JU1783]
MSGGTVMDHMPSLPHQNDQNVIRHLTNLVKSPASGDADIKKKEDSIMELGNILAQSKQTEELRKMIEQTRPFLVSLGKAKAAKLVRNLVDLCLMIDGQDGDIKVELVRECIQWATEQNRTFLRQTLEARLIRLFNDLGRYNQSLPTAAELIRELKKLDDKDVLVEVELEESKAYYHLGNIGKARASLTGARTTANAIYVHPKMQASLDLQSGILHAADEKDFKTAFSYFYEAFEGYDSCDKNMALLSLKYMLLCKVMLDVPDEVPTLLAGKLALKYSGTDLDAMRAIATASKKRSLADFNQTFGAYRQELQMDAVVKKHFNSLSETMLEKDLCRLIEPYSFVQIDHIANEIRIDRAKVEKKLAQMILDRKFSGSLHQGDGMLIVYDVSPPDPTYETALETIHAMGEVVDALYHRACKLRGLAMKRKVRIVNEKNTVRYHLSYIDEIFQSFHVHPQKSVQYVLQRVLITCGGEWEISAWHSANILLTCVGIHIRVPPSSFNLNEDHAARLITLVLKFATEEQKGRSIQEIQGADALFTALVESHNNTLCPRRPLHKFIDHLFGKTCNSDFSYVAHAICFIASLAPEVVYEVIKEHPEALKRFAQFFVEYQADDCPLRSQFIVRIVNFYLGGEFPGVCPVSVTRFVHRCIEDPNRSGAEREPLKPLIFSVLARFSKVPNIIQASQLAQQVTTIIKKGIEDPADLKMAFDRANNMLLHVLMNKGGWDYIQSKASVINFLKKNGCGEYRCYSPQSIAQTILHCVCKIRDKVVTDVDPNLLVSVFNTFNEKANWEDVVKCLDSDMLLVASREDLKFITDVLLAGLASSETAFPVFHLYKKWKNVRNQLKWLKHIVENPDIFSLHSSPHTPLPIGIFKTPPDDKNIFISNWKCVELYTILLTIAEESPELREEVQNVFWTAIPQFPDIILLGLFQSQLPFRPHQQDSYSLRSTLITIILKVIIPSHANAAAILHEGWNIEGRCCSEFRQIITNIFIGFYKDTAEIDDARRLTRILDLSHEVKPGCLSSLISSDELAFSVELACLASKRDYLKLDKWLLDKYQTHKEALLEDIIAILQKRAPASHGIVPPSANPLPDDLFVYLLQFCKTAIDVLGAKGNIYKDRIRVFEQQPEVMKESGRSSSVSSTGRAPMPGFPQHSDQLSGFNMHKDPILQNFSQNKEPGLGFLPKESLSGFPHSDPRIARPMMFGSSAASFNSLPSFMPPGQAHSAGNPMGLSNMFGAKSLGGSQELIKPSSGAQPISINTFPGSTSYGTHSPTNQSSRVPGPQAPQRQNSSSSSWSLPGATGHRPAGPPTPSQQMDFRAQLPPTGADFQVRQNPNQLSDDFTTLVFSEDIQEEANSYFEQIYNNSGVLTVHELIDRLKRFKSSNNPRDQKVLACVVKNLFEEYRFFGDYPERELKTTAEVYGGIIREGIISNLHFATAVRKVIESLSADPNSKLWTFGIVSLDHCRTKLKAYPRVCSMISMLENFNRFPPALQEFVLAGKNGDFPPNPSVAPTVSEGRSTPPVWQPGQRVGNDNKSGVATRTGNVLSYTNVDTLVNATEKEGAEAAQPPEFVVDKMSFLFNNLSNANIQAKREEVLGLINDHGEPFVKWLAQYIVMKRVSVEQNFQPLYNSFVQTVDHPLLDYHIKKETFRNIRILLRSDKRQAASNYSDRQLLKNLGSWLGSITIARSKPILIHELDLKSLLMEAYYKGQQELLFVVPFIAKILFSCSKTEIFGASCAWIRSVLKILAELHNEPDLKINLKFEIEVLCKELNVELHMLPVEGVLKDTDRLIRVQQQLSDLKLLARPDTLATSSPVPSQMRLAPDAGTPVTSDTKPGTPAPDAESSNQMEPTQLGNYAYHEINVGSYEGLAPHIQIKASLPLFQLHPQLKTVVRPALTQAIKELIGPVAERAQKIATTVTENLIRKDFALDPDEKNIKLASFHMMRAMTAGMAMITCRDPLTSTMTNYLQNAFQSALRSTANPGSVELLKMIDEASQTLTHDNVELATNFIVKTACEKAGSDMTKLLEPKECVPRMHAKQHGTLFTDESVEKIQASLPPAISVRLGPTRRELMEIYTQFSSRICGFKPNISDDVVPTETRPLAMPETDKQYETLVHQLNIIVKEIDTTMHAQPNVQNKAYQAVGVMKDLLSHLSVTPRDPNAVINCLTKSVEYLLHAYHVDPTTKNVLDIEWPRRLRDLFIGVTRVLLGWLPISEVSRRITNTIINLNVEYKWNVEAFEVLLKHNLIQAGGLDQHLAVEINGGSNLKATLFTQRLFRLLSGSNGGTDLNKCQILKDAFQAFPLTYEQLVKVHQLQQSGTRIPAPGEASGGMDSPAPAELLGPNREEGAGEISQKVVEGILREWISLCYTPMAQRSPQEALAQMIHTMHEHGVLSTDDRVSTFFRMCTEMCVDVTQRMIKQDPGNSFHQSTIIRQRCHYTLDAYVKLIALMIKHSDGSQAQTKITLLKKVLSIVTSVLHLDHEVRRTEFNPMPYHRILITLFNELTSPDSNATLEPIAWNILEAFGQALFVLQPRRCPGFAFAWLDIVGHRNVIGRLLGSSSDTQESMKMQAMYTQLIICHLKFLAPFLRNIHLPKSISVLYKGTLRVLLVILHDFPELLCEFHYVICDTIPANCVQLRNLVLSAYPRNMRLPDPFALNFKQVDSIPDMAQEPKSNLNMTTIIPENIRVPLDRYLNTRSSVDFLTSLPGMLQQTIVPGSKYNTTVMNAVVLYVGIRAIESLSQRRQPISISSIAHTSFMDIFQNLAVQLCTEGRYLLFNAIANQLRYPNAHTHYFSCVFLFLFLNSDCDAIQEQITRILFERLVALRPHPWGLLITFIELIKNPSYKFWKFEFTRCAPEIERLFQNVANTCVAPSRTGSATNDPPRA